MIRLPPLRDYQRRAVDDIRDAARELQAKPRPKLGYGILAVAPTGSGKTRIGLELGARALLKGGRVLWLAARTELVTQPADRLRAAGFHNIRTIQDGKDTGDPGAPIIVASVQTLRARNMAPPADVVVFDEARHFVAPDWGVLAGSYLDVVRVGLDATPQRADGRPLGDLFDRIVPVSSIAELTTLGWLVPSKVIGPSKHVKALSASPVTAWFEDARGKRSLVFMPNKPAAHKTAALFRAAGVTAEAVDADTPAVVRAAALDRLRSGELKVLVNVMLFTEGLDVPALESIIIARGLSSPAAWLQIGGRGLRPSPATGKTECVISDLRGHFHRKHFGPLDDPRVYNLDGAPITTPEALPSIVQCQSCHAWFRSGGNCGACGARLPPPPPPRITRRQRAELKRKRALDSRHGARWELFREIVLEQRAKGYKDKWCVFQFKARTGYFPKWRAGDVEGATDGP